MDRLFFPFPYLKQSNRNFVKHIVFLVLFLGMLPKPIATTMPHTAQSFFICRSTRSPSTFIVTQSIPVVNLTCLSLCLQTTSHTVPKTPMMDVPTTIKGSRYCVFRRLLNINQKQRSPVADANRGSDIKLGMICQLQQKVAIQSSPDVLTSFDEFGEFLFYGTTRTPKDKQKSRW